MDDNPCSRFWAHGSNDTQRLFSYGQQTQMSQYMVSYRLIATERMLLQGILFLPRVDGGDMHEYMAKAPANIRSDYSIAFLDDDCFHTHATLTSHNYLQSSTDEYAAFLQRIETVAAEEKSLLRTTIRCEVALKTADTKCDDIVDEIDKMLRDITDNDRTAPLYLQFFAKKSPSQLKRPILGSEFETIKTWIPMLQSSEHEKVVAMAQVVQQVVDDALVAVDNLTQARAGQRTFRLTGNRKRLFDDYNALRVRTAAAFSEFAYNHPELHLSNDFVIDHFRIYRKAATITIELIDEKIDDLNQQLGALQERRAELAAQAEVAAQARARAERKTIEDALAAAMGNLDEQQKRIEELKKLLEPAE